MCVLTGGALFNLQIAAAENDLPVKQMTAHHSLPPPPATPPDRTCLILFFVNSATFPS